MTEGNDHARSQCRACLLLHLLQTYGIWPFADDDWMTTTY